MPPKLSKSARQHLILTHLRATGTCHTLKDLEKTLPSVASINGIQVKEYIQALTDENRLRVEKIGSGNWYWSFASDEKHEQERHLARVSAEVEKSRKSCTEMMAALADETARREEEPEDEGKEGVPHTPEGRTSDGRGSELAGFRQDALKWTDNIYVLEEYLRKLAGGDRQMVEEVLRECYGDEYVDGEGLREL
ncbi:uncharacterized protein N7446_002182 [Penicillium canescens]|uniref:uncharacterized protein n=1 Tax=Penicillium canescens TaxID=5083 RepID=UPI0026E00DE2|nr:uncharacterized protein N7446_002182 [Penicillium canescens]KAJ6074405.1 hypothetical protein N7446_002182 [Penicillium canescens]